MIMVSCQKAVSIYYNFSDITDMCRTFEKALQRKAFVVAKMTYLLVLV